MVHRQSPHSDPVCLTPEPVSLTEPLAVKMCMLGSTRLLHSLASLTNLNAQGVGGRGSLYMGIE